MINIIFKKRPIIWRLDFKVTKCSYFSYNFGSK
nr:MAG TPA: hypothetical protein [Crassvirales sp.]